MRFRSIILSVLALVLVPACAQPDPDESTAEAQQAVMANNDLSDVKAAITGSNYSHGSKCIVLAAVNHYLAFTPGETEEDPGAWSLTTDPEDTYRLIPSVYDRIHVGTIQGDLSLSVPGETYLENAEMWTSDPALYSLEPGEHVGLPTALLGSP